MQDRECELPRRSVLGNLVHRDNYSFPKLNTGMTEYGAAAATGTDIEGLGQRYPLGKIGAPEGVANMVLYRS